ncbi:transporter substrate-binding domain-containing protein [Starkeya sp. ORNL1]|uniref:transporter substrate-binding domain-containing protein n=1 Tax=Starkeya sp. ORNL1 TaxID=2709380 RepID=UPI00146342D2|nr:transporter substrate-binding domain-containing protein [Starkeya sp. ORNL1]QJP15792.1 transporter substrate-binding domain-containing protein [Starkeya sp. ORNL1]
MQDEERSVRTGRPRHIRLVRGLAAAALAGLALAVPIRTLATGIAPPEPPIIRIGVPYVPLPTATPEARLYTEEGFELDLAAEIGRHLGKKVELVEVSDEAGAATLDAGRIDALLARIGDEDPRFSAVEIVPAGYASGLSVAMRSDTNVQSWQDLAGKTVCVAQANRQAQRLAEAAGAKLLVRRVPALSLVGVRTGECDAAIHDALLLDRLFTDEQWKKFSATLPPRDPTRLVVLLPRAQGRLFDRVRGAVEEMAHASEWTARRNNWVTTVAFEVYLDQDAPDCH